MRKAVFSFGLVSAFLATACTAATAAVLVESGSTLLYPLMAAWVQTYTSSHGGDQIQTNNSGSGAGIADAQSGASNRGASDAYLSDEQMHTSPLLHVALAVSAMQINYNVPEMSDRQLNLSGPLLAGMYDGTIVYWDDTRIAALNRGAKLPHAPIVPIHREDSSGDTFLFTQYLSATSASWKRTRGFGTHIEWPAVSKALAAAKNAGVLQACEDVPYSIAYVGVSFLVQSNRAALPHAKLMNRDGAVLDPTDETIRAAALAMLKHTPADERVSLVFAPGRRSYPLVNYEYALVRARQPNAEAGRDLAQFLEWVVDPKGGNSAALLAPVHFVQLPQQVLELSRRQISKIR